MARQRELKRLHVIEKVLDIFATQEVKGSGLKNQQQFCQMMITINYISLLQDAGSII